MNMIDIIVAKRDKRALTADQIKWFIKEFTANKIPDEQAGALLMAVFFNSLEQNELDVWVKAMIDSGEKLDLSKVTKPTVDKHSTGGVGDKISLPLVPIVAACGAAVPQLGGRGLGTFGGTIDKMESINGWRAQISNEDLIKQLNEIGGFIAQPGDNLAPADRKMYSFRDVIGCVESIPLISSSIMSKKIAEGTANLVLDVKVGRGAFMKELSQARELAQTMVQIGNNAGVKTVALLTQMNTPLGFAAGNALEVSESIEVLKGNGPKDLVELTLTLAKEMLALVKIDKDPQTVIDDGSALKIWEQMVSAQGGDLSQAIACSSDIRTVTATASGYITDLDAYKVGLSAWHLGAGRTKKEDQVSKTAGIVCLAKEGDQVEAGQPIFEMHIDDPSRYQTALAALTGAAEISPEPVAARPLVLERIA
jgi:thymidine phosphorylase